MKPKARKKRRTQPSPEPLFSRLDARVESKSRELLFLILAINILLSLILFDPKLHTGGDNAAYMILAENIVTPGKGYLDYYMAGEPKPHTHYPFGYPLLLAPLMALFGMNFIVLKLLSLAMGVGSVLLFTQLARSFLRPSVWAGTGLVFSLNPLMVEYSHWILSEIPFLFFCLLGLKLFNDSELKKKNRFSYSFWVSILCMAMAVHIRSIGIAFLFAGALYYLVRRAWIKCGVFVLTLLLLVMPWVIRNKVVTEDSAVYVTQIFQKNVYDVDQGQISARELAGRVAKNLKIYSVREMGRVFLKGQALSDGRAQDNIFSVGLTLVILIGFAGALWRRRGILEFFSLVYVGGILIFPEVASDVRYLLPLVPLLLLYLIEGTALLAGVAPGGSGRIAAAQITVLVLIALSGISSQAGLAPANLDNLQKWIRGDKYAAYPPNWTHLFEAAQWVRQETDVQSVVCVRKPRIFHLLSQRQVTLYPYTADTDSVLAIVMKSDYVVIDAVSGTTGRYLVPALQKRPGSFKLVFDRRYAKVVEVLR